MKSITIRTDEETTGFLRIFSEAPTTAAQTVIEVFMHLHRKTIEEIRGTFTREEIIGMAGSMNGLIPTWKIQVNPNVFVWHTEESEKYESAISIHGASFPALIEKIKVLTPAQATCLQLELWAFWNRNESTSPDLELLIKRLS